MLLSGIYNVYVGNISVTGKLCGTKGDGDEQENPFRLVVSVPSSHVNVAEDGTVTLK